MTEPDLLPPLPPLDAGGDDDGPGGDDLDFAPPSDADRDDGVNEDLATIQVRELEDLHRADDDGSADLDLGIQLVEASDSDDGDGALGAAEAFAGLELGTEGSDRREDDAPGIGDPWASFVDAELPALDRGPDADGPEGVLGAAGLDPALDAPLPPWTTERWRATERALEAAPAGLRGAQVPRLEVDAQGGVWLVEVARKQRVDLRARGIAVAAGHDLAVLAEVSGKRAVLTSSDGGASFVTTPIGAGAERLALASAQRLAVGGDTWAIAEDGRGVVVSADRGTTFWTVPGVLGASAVCIATIGGKPWLFVAVHDELRESTSVARVDVLERSAERVAEWAPPPGAEEVRITALAWHAGELWARGAFGVVSWQAPAR